MTRARRATVALLAASALAATYPRTGGDVRVYFPGEPWDPMPAGLHGPADLALSGMVFSTLVLPGPRGTVTPGVAISWERTDPHPGEAERWIVRLDPLARLQDGRPVAADDVITSWESLLRTGDSPYRFLLDPVLGAGEFAEGSAEEIRGLVSDGDVLRIALLRPTPDLPERLAHPALAVGLVDRFGAPVGPGPFQLSDRGEGLAANALHSAGRPFLDGVSVIRGEGVDPSLLVEAGEVQAALLFGRAAGRVADRSPEGVRVARAPGWDRVYALALAPGSDLFERREQVSLLRESIDPVGIVRLLFDGRGEAVHSLLWGPPSLGPGPRPEPGTTSPRVRLSFDRTDLMASSIAARVKATWEAVRVPVTLDGLEPPELRGQMLRGGHDAALILHQPVSADPVLDLMGTVSALGPGHEDALSALREGAVRDDATSRSESAAGAEWSLRANSRLIPLVRLQAWLATDDRLVGIRTDVPGVLRFDDAFLLP